MTDSINRPDSPLARLYDYRIRSILEGNIRAVVDLYSERGVLINAANPDEPEPLYVAGHEALRKFFEARAGSIASVRTRFLQWAEGKRTLMAIARAKFTFKDGSSASVLLHDSWYLKKGKIAVHFVGAIREPIPLDREQPHEPDRW